MVTTTLYLRTSGRLPITVSRHAQEDLTFRFDEDTWATVFATETEEGITNSGKTMLAATSRHSVPDAWVDLLAGIPDGRWPPGFARAPGQQIFDFYPADLQQFLTSEVEKSRRHAHEAFGLIRWRWSAEVEPGSLVSTTATSWSPDRERWQRLHMPLMYEGHLWPQLQLCPPTAEALEVLATADAKEPAGREIWHVAVNADHRTAIVLAVAAVEVEVKRLVSHFVPAADWLMINLPAPPVSKIIKNYLPEIGAVQAQLVPPGELLATLEKAIKIRNDFVHVGPETASSWLSPSLMKTRRGVMAAASDLLWLFDAYRGHTWALEYLSRETRLSLGLPVEPEDPPRVVRVPPDRY